MSKQKDQEKYFYKRKGFHYPETLAWHICDEISKRVSKGCFAKSIIEDREGSYVSIGINELFDGSGQELAENLGSLIDMIGKPIKSHFDYGTYRHYRVVGVNYDPKTTKTEVFLSGYRSSEKTPNFD